jgi:hypothetical protein
VHRLATSHASEVVQSGEDWFITSCSRNVADVTHSYSDRTRGLYLAKLLWQDDRPYVAALDPTSGIPTPALTAIPTAVSPNPVERGGIVSLRLPDGSRAGEHEVFVYDARSSQVSRAFLMAIVDEGGARVVEISTAGLAPGVYFVRVGTGVARVVVL